MYELFYIEILSILIEFARNRNKKEIKVTNVKRERLEYLMEKLFDLKYQLLYVSKKYESNILNHA